MVNTLLAQFLRDAAGRPFVWGQFDCGLWLADWVRLSRGLSFDPAEHFRGRYSDGRSALRALGHSGLGSTVADIAARCCLETTSDPMRGDIGLVRLVGERATGAIAGAGGWWLFDNGRGICRAPVAMLDVPAAWRV
jgi:hypothetical protein